MVNTSSLLLVISLFHASSLKNVTDVLVMECNKAGLQETAFVGKE
jgi:hypothetical protein